MIKKEIEDIIFTYDRYIYNFFIGKVASSEDHEDLYQESCVAIIEAYPRFQFKSSVKTWIYSICNNILKTYYYRKKNNLSYDLVNDTVSYQETQDDLLIELVLEEVEDKYRLFFDLHYRQRLSIKEIAKLMQKPEGTVKYYLYLLRKKMKDLLI